MEFANLFTDSSRATADMAASLILEKPELLKEALRLSYLEKPRLSMRVSRVLGICNDQYPEMLKPYVDEMILKLTSLHDESVKRNLLRVLAEHIDNLSEDSIGILTHTCFELLESSTQPIAIHVYCMELLYRISVIIPDIEPELVATIEHRITEGSSGIKSRGTIILKKLYARSRNA